jgi:YD repeat-containing protein
MHASASIIVSLIFMTSLAGSTDMLKTKVSDHELRGPVRECIERTTYPASDYTGERTVTTTSVFSADGSLLERRVGSSGSNDYVTSYTYDAAGRLLKVSSGNENPSGTTKFDSSYVYDAKGQLISINSSSGNQQIINDRGEDGRRRVTERFPERLAGPNVGVGAIPWQGSDLPFPPPSGGTITTIYDEHDRPTEAQVRDGSGQLTMQIVRTYDKDGRILSDKLIPEEVQSQLQDELGSQFNEAQKKAMAGFIASAFYTGESNYKYDADGRVIEKRLSRGAVGDTSTKITYNDNGDVSEEVTMETKPTDFGGEFKMDDAGNLSPVPTASATESTQTETHYAYEYDAHGNWTRRTTSARSGKNELTTSAVVERTLTYYPDK